MECEKFLIIICTIIASFIGAAGVEFTFELPENEKQCFYENIPPNVTATLEFRVVAGGQYDVDVTLTAPNEEIMYNEIKTPFDIYTFMPKLPGIHVVCFGNEFSTDSHKTIYMDFQIDKQISSTGNNSLVTEMESSAKQIFKHLSIIHNYQVHHRLKEAKGRKKAENLNEQILWWTVLEIFVILVSTIGQVFIVVKDFTLEKKRNQEISNMQSYGNLILPVKE